MVDVVGTAITRIYENQSLTVTARIEKNDAGTIEEVTFKFLNDGKQFEEKTVAMSAGKESDGFTVVSHAVKAPAVADDKSSYFLDYHYFYKVKNLDGTTETLQNFPANRIQVFPRAAQLKVTDKDGKAFHGFDFRVEQDGRLSETRKTFAASTPNAKGETVAAGSCEFNLELFAGFRIVPSPPYQILEEVTGTGRKRVIKGGLGFRARFVAPSGGAAIKQLVNYDIESQGQTGIGHAVTIEIGVHPEDLLYLHGIDKPAVHFRVSYGPESGAVVEKSARDDAAHPTKVTKASASDSSVTIEEKEAKKKYQGKVVLTDGAGKFVVGLGKAGGDTCKVEISGSANFLTAANVPADDTLEFENWRQVHYELMVPDLLRDRLEPSSLNFDTPTTGYLDKLGRDLFIRFEHDKTHVFDTVAHADYGTLAPARFLGLNGPPDAVAYVLSGRNWRKLPEKQSWAEAHPGKSLYIAFCHLLLKWRQDTKDKKAGTKDFSGTLKEVQGKINVQEKFEGLFMPFSGHDAGEGVEGIHWTADISKDDAVCKYKPSLEIKDERIDNVAIATGLNVSIVPDEALPSQPARILFKRLPYPKLEVSEKTKEAEKDDGKLWLKEAVLAKELVLEFKLPEARDEKSGSEKPGGGPSSAYEVSKNDGTKNPDGNYSDWGSSPQKSNVKTDGHEYTDAYEERPVNAAHRVKIENFFKALFKDGKSKLSASDEANKFRIEIHGGKGEDHRRRRILELKREVEDAYDRTYDHEKYDFKKDLAPPDIDKIQHFVDSLLVDPTVLSEVKGRFVVKLECPKDAKNGVDDCFKAVKGKLTNMFAATAKDFASHPGLDPDKQFAPRHGNFSLSEITVVDKSSVKEWHFQLPVVLRDGTLGPGSFIGPGKTAEKCPVKFELKFQSHEGSFGEVDGKRIAWACSEQIAERYLISLVLQAFQIVKGDPCLDHGHGKDGMPGQCLISAGELCAKCIAFGRSKNLTLI